MLAPLRAMVRVELSISTKLKESPVFFLNFFKMPQQQDDE
jgi:hypothetical protein